ncbi:MAG TPA: GNAT family N-acetyltransferase [Clostridiales bacterium]|nr:MAG: Acetyltransferase (GNAT) family protein [Firmicutes bacterium ADurb.Bin262]HOU10711.1 GNAT family N-acetyltransferase [Clostridiales bacterium]HQK74260.1 GNAT family N-acetyltransferase [Clostridiales bacterium]
MPEKPDSQTAQTADELPSLKMWRPDIPLPDALLPEGYAVRVLKDDEGVYWCSCFEKDDMGITELSQELFKTKMLDDSNVPAGSIIAVENKDHIPVATCTAQLKDGEPYLHMVATSPQARGKGLGLAACAAALKMHIEQGRKGCWLITQDFRLAAIKQYLRLGFLPVLFHESLRGRWEVIAGQLGLERLACVGEDLKPMEDILSKTSGGAEHA